MYRYVKSDSGRGVQIYIALGLLKKKVLFFSGDTDSWNAKVVNSSAEDVEFVSCGGVQASNAFSYIRTTDKTFFVMTFVLSPSDQLLVYLQVWYMDRT